MKRILIIAFSLILISLSIKPVWDLLMDFKQDWNRKYYNEIKAVDDISFSVSQGEIYGFLGQNGAGKSTTIKMLTGILVPSSGRIVVDGRVPHQQRVAHVRRIGVVFGQRSQLWWDLPTIESFELLRHIYRIPEARWRSNLREFVELLDIGSFLDTPVRQLVTPIPC